MRAVDCIIVPVKVELVCTDAKKKPRMYFVADVGLWFVSSNPLELFDGCGRTPLQAWEHYCENNRIANLGRSRDPLAEFNCLELRGG